MWIFGQVWFACLVGFAAGVLLDWVVRVRPLANRVTDLETRLEADNRSVRAEAVANGGSMFERGSYEGPGRFDSTGFDGDRSRGLLTPSASAGSLATDLLEPPSTPPADEPVIARTGVEDFPGVARLSGIWADENAEETRVTHAEPPAWQGDPEPATWDHDAAAAAENAEAATPTSVEPLVPSSAADADRQYLEFLRSGGAEPIASSSPPETSGEVTSVLPYSIPGEEADGYQPYEAYEEFSTNGYGANNHQEDYSDTNGYGGYQDAGYQNGGYQEDVVEPVESSGPLPHRHSAEFGQRYAPFEIPFGQFDNSDVQPRGGELTPIGDGGFDPFQKHGGLDEAGGDGGEPTDASSWFDLTDPGHGSTTMTSRMLPIGQPGEEHPDLLGTSVFGGEHDVVYEDDGHARSLFEPVIAPDSVPAGDDYTDDYADDYRGYGEHSDPGAPLFDPTGGQGTTPRPIRVRTGMDPAPAHGSAGSVGTAGSVGSAGSAHSLTADTVETAAPGPFGPGSALPLPDGTAPSGEFRVKARTSSMVFHTESSPFYERLEPQVWFRDAKDAQRAGFTSWERPRSW